ncbi:hypothetical protein F5Y13DRAFT_198144 [Hypoxylon sp. FL1857]|nr:hypothetical protein F5Y13DRAFT_198144 [Hypoxylon sp. FL1857]
MSSIFTVLAGWRFSVKWPTVQRSMQPSELLEDLNQSKCQPEIIIDETGIIIMVNDETQISDEQWQAIMELQRALLQKHPDFFLASQQPSVSSTTPRQESKHDMPVRMWRHDIDPPTEATCYRRPYWLEHMLTFILTAYSMMALLYDTVPAFNDAWTGCLGDSEGYAASIENVDIGDREAWTSVSQRWCANAPNKAPNTGRLSYHLAILAILAIIALPNPIQKLYYYTKSFCVSIPSISTQKFVETLSPPDPDPTSSHYSPQIHIDRAFLGSHDTLFNKPLGNFVSIGGTFVTWCSSSVDRGKVAPTWPGYQAPVGRKRRIYRRNSRQFGVNGIGSVMRSLHPLLWTSLVSHIPMGSASPTQRIPNIQEVKPHDTLAFIIAWYTCLLGAVVGYIFLSVYHQDGWSFLGLGMGVSAWAYLVMVLVGDVPLDVIVSAGIVCAVFTSLWTSYDLRESGMRQSRQQLAKYCIVTGAVLLDIAISLSVTPTSNPLLGAQKPPSPGFMMSVLAVPCATLSVVLCKTIRTVGAILAEPEAQLAGYPAPNQ